MKKQNVACAVLSACLACAVPASGQQPAAAPPAQPALPSVVLPMGRTAYFVGEKIPLTFAGTDAAVPLRLEGVNADGRVPLYQGKPATLLLDTARLAPGDYRLELNGTTVVSRLTITPTLRRSAASLQDEATPANPQLEPNRKYSDAESRALQEGHWDKIVRTFEESGLRACVSMASSDMGQAGYLDAMARAGALLLVNPDTRPTSFLPASNQPDEISAMSQRMILTAQANGRYPNFGGFCYGWDTTGYAVGGRRMLLVYWGWGKLEQPLRRYLERIDQQMMDIFRRRTGLEPVTEAEYAAYLLSIQRPEFSTMIDLPSKTWLEEIARHVRPMAPAERAVFERRLDAWSAYLMGMYAEVYSTFSANLRGVDPSLRHTASVQVDHCAVRQGQYFPAAYAPLDFRYQSTWNDQVGGPDYVYQWLYTAGLLDMGRAQGQPTWLSNAIAAAHGRAAYPGKFTRVAAHGLAFGVTGIGFALEGFSNLLGGMARNTNWENLRGTGGGADVLAGREFLERFAALATAGRGDHGVGILFSKSQFQRQHATMGFGQTNYMVFVALTRLGYTPRFVTEEEIEESSRHAPRAVRPLGDLKTLVLLGQTFPLPAAVSRAIESFVRSGGTLVVDRNTTIELKVAGTLRVPSAGLEKTLADGTRSVPATLDLNLPFSQPGKPHNLAVPNMPEGDNDTQLFDRWYAANASKLVAALGEAGRGVFTAQGGPLSPVSLLQLRGGRDARYIIAVNDSHVATQADWYEVREKLLPAKSAGPAVVYDATEEKRLGPLGPIDCDLTRTTARVLAVLPRAMKTIELAATQRLQAGGELVVTARFLGDDGQPLVAVLPFHLGLIRPDGTPDREFYRATAEDGRFSFSIPMAANVPSGRWQLVLRSQLDGRTATLPIELLAPQPGQFAARLPGKVLVRGRTAIDPLLERGQKLVLPVFDSPDAPRLAAAARKIQAVLAAKGVEVEIRDTPRMTDYWLAYDPTDAQKQENQLADRGESFGRLQRERGNNANDWFAVLSGWRFGRPVILLDLVTVQGDNPIVESLNDPSKHDKNTGLLWPEVSEAFPGQGRAVIHGLYWAFAPRVGAIVIQAADESGLLGAADALAHLPPDLLSPRIEQARTRLWQERGIGPAPAGPSLAGLGSDGLRIGQSPRPFRIAFCDAVPPSVSAARALQPKRPERLAVTLPATFDPQKQLVPMLRDGDRTIEATAISFLVPDLRFNHALGLVADVKQPGPTKIVVACVFRYSDRQPMMAPQWEDVLKLYEKTVPHQRRQMEIEVLVGGKSVGTLRPGKVESREIALEMKPSHGAKEVRKAVEEVVTEIRGEVPLAAGRQEIVLIHRNIIDGKVEAVGIGVEPQLPLPKPR